jgi:hypothetical protein
MPVSGDDFRNLVRRARYREAPSSGSMAGDPGPRIAQQGIAGRGQAQAAGGLLEPLARR